MLCSGCRCQRAGQPWDYCSPPLVFQQDLQCPAQQKETLMVPDPSDCARYLTCQVGRTLGLLATARLI